MRIARYLKAYEKKNPDIMRVLHTPFTTHRLSNGAKNVRIGQVTFQGPQVFNALITIGKPIKGFLSSYLICSDADRIRLISKYSDVFDQPFAKSGTPQLVAGTSTSSSGFKWPLGYHAI